MRPTRKIIAEFFCVFVCGAIAGGLLSRCYTEKELTAPDATAAPTSEQQLSSFMNHTNDPAVLVARINKKYADEYHLTPEELNKIQPLINDMSQGIYKVRHQFGIDILSTLDDYHGKIADQLTPEHKESYLKAMDERRKILKVLLQLDQGSPTQGPK